MLHLEKFDVVEYGLLSEVLDGRADVFQPLQAELERINIRCIDLLHETHKLPQHLIRLGNLLPCPHHRHVEHPTARIARLQFELLEHVA